MAVADPRDTAGAVAEFVDREEVGADVRQSVEWTAEVLQDPVSRERAKSTFDTFVDPAEIDRVFELWRDALPVRDLSTAPCVEPPNMTLLDRLGHHVNVTTHPGLSP